MSSLLTQLKKKAVFFSNKLPSHKTILDIFINSNGAGLPSSTIGSNGSTLPSSKDLLESLKNKNKKNRFLPILVVCDQKLKNKTKVKSWLKDYLVYFVKAGEGLKNLSDFPNHVEGVLKKINGHKILGMVSVGGGSVGDFTGFLASVYKRGVPLVHIPSTWLSSMDSAHGGKTALNAGAVKNVLGTYHFPKAVLIVKDMFYALSEKQRASAFGELIKIALIEGGSFYKALIKQNSITPKGIKKKSIKQKSPSALVLWNFLPLAIFSKWKVVSKDPYEKKGTRLLLNFGHTLGHALELHFRIPHGEAVTYGMLFSLYWSHKKWTLSNDFLREIAFLTKKQKKLAFYLKQIPEKTLYHLLLRDKKQDTSNTLNFIFIRGPGRVFVKKVFIQDILTEIRNIIRGDQVF